MDEKLLHVWNEADKLMVEKIKIDQKAREFYGGAT